MNQITILNQANVPIGPFTREQVTEKLQSGEVTMSSMAFIEGLSQWTPLRDVLARLDAAAAPALRSAAPAAGSPAYSYAATMQPPTHLVYAGFWLRFVAFLVDGIILTIAGAVVGGIVGFAFGISMGIAHAGTASNFTNTDGSPNVAVIILQLIVTGMMIVLQWLYYALQECSAAQATLGKRVLGLRVTNLAGARIGFGQATGRYFGKIISGCPTLLIGFIMAGFTERKQALHDMLAGTLVVRS